MTVLVSLMARRASSSLRWLPRSRVFADEEDGAAVLAWLFAEEVEGEAERVEDGGSVCRRGLRCGRGERGGAVFKMMLTGGSRV